MKSNRMNKKWRFLQIALLVCALAGLASYLLYDVRTKEPARPSGFCRAQQRYISDEEFTEIAVRARNLRIKGLTQYANRDFDVSSTNCCRVLRDEAVPRVKEIKESYGISYPIVVVELNNETSRVD